jgi:MFS family permease
MRALALSKMLGNSPKNVVVNIIIVANAFIWYSYAFSYLTNAITAAGFSEDFLWIVGIHFLGVFASVIIGEYLGRRTQSKLPLIKYWMAAGSLLSLIPLTTGVNTVLGLSVLSAATGVAFGFGLPAAMSYFAQSTEPANRGRLGGITFLLSGLGAFLISGVGTDNIFVASLVLASWRLAGLAGSIILKPSDNQTTEKRRVSYRQVLTNRAFLLYFVPWTMFMLVNSLAFPVIEKQPQLSIELVHFSSSIEFVLAGISAVLFGILADNAGRKRLAVAGFTLLGLGYAVLGFSSGNIYGWWFYTAIDGIAWGSFAMTFLFVLWGDLAEDQRGEKFYAVGIMPYLISSFVRFSMGSYVATAISNYAMIFSYFSFFLFLAVLPLVYAPETLPEKVIKTLELNSYLTKAQEIVAKAQKKEETKQEESNKKDEEECKVEFQVPQEDAEEAEKLAEKYY